MRKAQSLAILGLSFLTVFQPAYGKVSESEFHTNCSFGKFKSSPELAVWLENCMVQIRKARNKQDHAEFDKSPVSCTFRVNEAGEIENMRILKSSGDEKVDESARKILLAAQPFKPYTDQILVARGVCVQFSKDPAVKVTLPPPLFKKAKNSPEQPLLSPK